MSRGITNKSVDKFVECLNDRRFSSQLFAIAIEVESDDVKDVFFEIIISYLNLLTIGNQFGIRDSNTVHLASKASKMLNAYLEAGGAGEYPTSLNLDRFDRNIS